MNEPSASRRISRESAISRLRAALIRLVDDEHSICLVAAQKGIFCQGFRRYSDAQLEEKYRSILRATPGASRAAIEDLANRWQLSRQLFDEVPLACDAQQREHDTCHGWDEFTNEDLARFCLELLGQDVSVT